MYIYYIFAYIINVGIKFPTSEHTKDYSFVSFSDIIIIRGDDYISDKTFLTINELIDNIKSKNINLNNEDSVRQILEINNYYFIMGYKFAFKNTEILSVVLKNVDTKLQENKHFNEMAIA